jgi:hypothetical protein
VASHYIFFDPGPRLHIIGTVDFDSNVLAIITSTANLAASDFLANTGVNYLNPGARGLEAGDSVTISGPRQILFDTFASSPGDCVRVGDHILSSSSRAGSRQRCVVGKRASAGRAARAERLGSTS